MLLQPYRRSQSDTVRALEELLVEAKAGHLIGFAYVAMRQPREISAGVAGEPRRSPIAAALTCGMLRVLETDLEHIIRGIAIGPPYA